MSIKVLFVDITMNRYSEMSMLIVIDKYQANKTSKASGILFKLSKNIFKHFEKKRYEKKKHFSSLICHLFCFKKKIDWTPK